MKDGTARTISREDLAKLPIRRWAGRVCVAATPQDLDEARSAAKPSSGGAYSVLIVEDEPALAATMRKFLELERFVPRVAANRDEVAAELRKPPLPDLILLDVMLAGASGFDILERLRGHPVLKPIPIIMVTAMSAREDVMRALAGDANGYITKPFKLDVLMKSIKAVLGIG